MKATEDDWHLSLRGYVMARGGYTPDDIRKMTYEEILFIHHYQNRTDEERQNFLNTVLGVVWSAEEFIEKPQPAGARPPVDTGPPDKMFIPLSMAINPELVQRVKESLGLAKGGNAGKSVIGGGDYMPKENEVIHSMADMSKAEFKRMMGSR